MVVSAMGDSTDHLLDLARQIGSSWDQAHALAGLGRCVLAAGHTAQSGEPQSHECGISTQRIACRHGRA